MFIPADSRVKEPTAENIRWLLSEPAMPYGPGELWEEI